MKKAFLVEYCIRTRVVVDVPDDYSPIGDKPMTDHMAANVDDIIIAKAGDKVISDAQAYVIGDNITCVEEDIEMPYDPEFDD